MDWEQPGRQSEHEKPEARRVSPAEYLVGAAVVLIAIIGIGLFFFLNDGGSDATATDEIPSSQDFDLGPGGDVGVPNPSATPDPSDPPAEGADERPPPNDVTFGPEASDASEVVPDHPELAAPEPSFETAEYGFRLLHPRATLRPAYEIRVVDGPGIDDILPTLRAVAEEFNAEMSTTRLTVGAEPLPDVVPEEELNGIIQVRLGNPQEFCDPDVHVAGCASPDFDGALRITGGNIVIRPDLGSTNAATLRITRHELGHVLNLEHFDVPFNGSFQVMHPGGRTAGPLPADLQDGDRNGLRFMGNSIDGPIAPDSPPSTEFEPRCAIGQPC